MSRWRESAALPRRSSRKTGPVRFPMLLPFCQRLERLRLDRGLTQRALATRAGISLHHYQDLVHARANPTIVVFLNLADALSVPVTELFDPPHADGGRSISVATLRRELSAIHRRLTGLIARLGDQDLSVRP